MTDKLREAAQQALTTIEAAIITLAAANEQGKITDTIWVSEFETLFDFLGSEADALRAALAENDVQQEIEAALAQPEQEQITTDFEIIHQAVQTVIQAMQYDPEYAWGWHCNIAMAFVDAGGDHYTANQGAARFLEMFAKVQPAHELPAPEQDMVAYEIEAKLKEKNT